MKKFYTLLLLFFLVINLKAQTAQQHQAPPVNNFPYTRGMFVDCTDDILTDMRNGNVLGGLSELQTYIRENFIGYVAFYHLDQNKVFGKPVMENQLRQMITLLKDEFPQLRIGFVGKKSGYTVRSKAMKATDFFSAACVAALPVTMTELDSMINDVRNTDDLQRSETIKFFLRTIEFGKSFRSDRSRNCKTPVDAFYLEDQYWQNISSGTLTAAKVKFESFKSVLRFLQALKCPCLDISIETEFEPTDYFRLSGWTATDQIEQADPLIDRMMIPFYTSPFNAGGAYDINCRLLHLLSDQFSKNGTRFYCGFSAQSNAFAFCNSASTPLEHLGRYLMGLIPMASGNMYSVEKFFLDKLNDPGYMCAGCSCFPYSENQYSPANPAANMCTGSMWFTYSMLKNNSLFKKRNDVSALTSEEKIEVRTFDSHLEIMLRCNKKFSFQLVDSQGRKIRDEMKSDYAQTIEIGSLADGTYFLNATTTDGQHFNRCIPVLHR